jgi:hypothetical protein
VTIIPINGGTVPSCSDDSPKISFVLAPTNAVAHTSVLDSLPVILQAVDINADYLMRSWG